MAKNSFLFLLFLLLCPALSLASQVSGVRMWSSPDGTRLVFDINAPVEHRVFVLENPHRVVIDLKNTFIARNLKPLDFSHSSIQRMRSAKRNQSDLRVVLDTKAKVSPKSFLLRPMAGYGHRLVLDLQDVQVSHSRSAKKSIRTLKNSPRPIIVAIDAGHGGEDPGAIGQRGTREKDVVYQISKKFYKMLEQEPGIKPVLIRSGDYYVSLRNRIRKAREYKADLFISIHADAVKNGRARGASVFVLSQRGASSEAARWLAKSQNDSDLIGGVSLDDKGDILASVLLDLSQNATIAASSQVGSTILSELGGIGNLHKGKVERAGFVVLKSPDIPSILVETGFISNAKEERNLKSKRFQHKVAYAMLKGVKNYFRKNPPPGSVYAMAPQAPVVKIKNHTIQKGETISAIAKKYNISLSILKKTNSLSGDLIHPGQVLRIPLSLDNS